MGYIIETISSDLRFKKDKIPTLIEKLNKGSFYHINEKITSPEQLQEALEDYNFNVEAGKEAVHITGFKGKALTDWNEVLDTVVEVSTGTIVLLGEDGGTWLVQGEEPNKDTPLYYEDLTTGRLKTLALNKVIFTDDFKYLVAMHKNDLDALKATINKAIDDAKDKSNWMSDAKNANDEDAR